MITLFQSDRTYKLVELKSLMVNQIKQVPAKISPIGNCSKILRYEFKCEPVDILSWLHNQRTDIKLYWSNRDGTFEVGALGAADTIKGENAIDHRQLFESIKKRLSDDNPCLRYYGGINFNEPSRDHAWQNFGPYRFIVPLFELTRTNEQTVFAFNIVIDRFDRASIEQTLEILENLDFSPLTTYRNVPQILHRTDLPDRQGWNKNFAGINANESEKVVLARKSVFDFDVDLRADALLKHLKDRTPDCYHFMFQFLDKSAFLGASPERLFKTSAEHGSAFRTIESEAIAGTRPRVKDEQQDKILEDQLLNSQKDAVEHKFVVDAIADSIQTLCSQYRSDDSFSLRKLKGSQHLRTGFEGKLKAGVTDQDILESLHPTPAVAGTPTPRALTAIKKLEPFDRGWYAGPVGYIGSYQTEFAVAIRSGLITGNQLALFAGAGIVEGSTADDEWNEIENKIGNFMEVFNVRNADLGSVHG